MTRVGIGGLAEGQAAGHGAAVKSTEPEPTETSDPHAALFEKLRLQGVKLKPKNAFLKTFGWAKDRPGFDEAMRLGAEWRAELNRKSIYDASLLTRNLADFRQVPG